MGSLNQRTMPVDTTASIVIDRPASVVAAYLRDPTNDPHWIGGIRSARQVGSGPIGVGTQVARVATFLGREIQYVNEIVELTDDHLTMRSVRSPFPMRVTYGFDQTGSTTTRAWVRVEGDASGLYGLAAPLLNRAVHRSISGDVKRLKRILEASDSRASGSHC
jgi:uncharacterized membrane protein